MGVPSPGVLLACLAGLVWFFVLLWVGFVVCGFVLGAGKWKPWKRFGREVPPHPPEPSSPSSVQPSRLPKAVTTPIIPSKGEEICNDSPLSSSRLGAGCFSVGLSFYRDINTTSGSSLHAQEEAGTHAGCAVFPPCRKSSPCPLDHPHIPC